MFYYTFYNCFLRIPSVTRRTSKYFLKYTLCFFFVETLYYVTTKSPPTSISDKEKELKSLLEEMGTVEQKPVADVIAKLKIILESEDEDLKLWSKAATAEAIKLVRYIGDRKYMYVELGLKPSLDCVSEEDWSRLEQVVHKIPKNHALILKSLMYEKPSYVYDWELYLRLGQYSDPSKPIEVQNARQLLLHLALCGYKIVERDRNFLISNFNLKS